MLFGVVMVIILRATEDEASTGRDNFLSAFLSDEFLQALQIHKL